MKTILFVVSIVIVLLAKSSFAETFKSSITQVPLIELYTSEGCSSCPPADRWMTSLVNEERLWKDYVPIAFHVDYWDYLGWPDRFASQEFSQRQRRYAAEFNEPTVYTPGMRKAGVLWRNWLYGRLPELSDAKDVGILTLKINDDDSFIATLSADQPSESSRQINIAVLGLGLTTYVKRGENTGKTLVHNFVVLGMSTVSSLQSNQWRGMLPKPSVSAPSYAVAAWLTEGGSLTPIQVVGGKLAAR